MFQEIEKGITCKDKELVHTAPKKQIIAN